MLVRLRNGNYAGHPFSRKPDTGSTKGRLLCYIALLLAEYAGSSRGTCKNEGSRRRSQYSGSNDRRRYEAGIHNLFELYLPISDYWMITDNSMSPMEVIAKGFKNDKREVYNLDIFTKLEHHE